MRHRTSALNLHPRSCGGWSDRWKSGRNCARFRSGDGCRRFQWNWRTVPCRETVARPGREGRKRTMKRTSGGDGLSGLRSSRIFAAGPSFPPGKSAPAARRTQVGILRIQGKPVARAENHLRAGGGRGNHSQQKRGFRRNSGNLPCPDQRTEGLATVLIAAAASAAAAASFRPMPPGSMTFTETKYTTARRVT